MHLFAPVAMIYAPVCTNTIKISFEEKLRQWKNRAKSK